MMLTIKAASVAAVLLVGATAAITYATTITVLVPPVQQAAAPDDACRGVLAELQAEREKKEVQERAFKKYTEEKPWAYGKGKEY